MVGWLTRFFSSQPAPAKAPASEAIEEPQLSAQPTPQAEGAPLPVGENRNDQPEQQTLSFQRVPQKQIDGLNANLMNWLFEGFEQSYAYANELEKEIMAALDKIIESNQAASDMVRRMPGVIPQLLQSLRTDDFSGAELARTISNDVVLVAEVIRIANSALYRSSDAIGSVEHAVLVIGQTGLRQLITSVAFKPIIDLRSGNYTRAIAPKIWEHSEKCAITNRILAEGEQISGFEAFLAGLTQYVGLIVSLRVIDQFADQSKSVGSLSFCSSLIERGRKISASIGREWHFPESVVQAIEDQGKIDKLAGMSQLGLLLETGDYVSKMKILLDQKRLNADDPQLLDGLSDKALNCLRELQALDVDQQVEE